MANEIIQTPQNEKEGFHPQDAKDKQLIQFIKEYKLHQIEDALVNEGITLNFLLNQTETEIEEIAQELTTSSIQQKKLKYAVQQTKKLQNKNRSIQQNYAKKAALNVENSATEIYDDIKEQSPSKSEIAKKHKKRKARLNKTVTYKAVTLGSTRVGKSSIIIRFVNNQFSDFQESTIGAAFLTQSIRVQDGMVKLEIWDTAGQERYRSLAPMYYRGSHVALCVYDITNVESYEKAKSWVQELKQQWGSCDDCIALIGNKIDLNDWRNVSSEEAREYADSEGIHFLETSAKTNVNIRGIFTLLVEKAVENHATGENDGGNEWELSPTVYFDDKKEKWCC